MKEPVDSFTVLSIRHCQLPARLKLREKKYRLPDYALWSGKGIQASRPMSHLRYPVLAEVLLLRDISRMIGPLPNRKVAISRPPARNPHSVRLQADVYVTACASGGREGRRAGGGDQYDVLAGHKRLTHVSFHVRHEGLSPFCLREQGHTFQVGKDGFQGLPSPPLDSGGRPGGTELCPPVASCCFLRLGVKDRLEGDRVILREGVHEVEDARPSCLFFCWFRLSGEEGSRVAARPSPRGS